MCAKINEKRRNKRSLGLNWVASCSRKKNQRQTMETISERSGGQAWRPHIVIKRFYRCRYKRCFKAYIYFWIFNIFERVLIIKIKHTIYVKQNMQIYYVFLYRRIIIFRKLEYSFVYFYNNYNNIFSLNGLNQLKLKKKKLENLYYDK